MNKFLHLTNQPLIKVPEPSSYQQNFVVMHWLLDTVAAYRGDRIFVRTRGSDEKLGISRHESSMLVITPSENFRLDRSNLLRALRDMNLPDSHVVHLIQYFSDRPAEVYNISTMSSSFEELEIIVERKK